MHLLRSSFVLLSILRLTTASRSSEDVISSSRNDFAMRLAAKLSPAVDFQLLRREYLVVAYGLDLHNPLFVAFEMKPEEQRLNQGGRKHFIKDPMLALTVQTSVDCECFGPLADLDAERVFGSVGGKVALDRGHLAPSYAFTFDKSDKGAFWETYLITNVAPQGGMFNRYSWRMTEEHLTDYVVARNRKLLVVAGTAYDDIANPALIDGTAIPSYFWLAICDPELGESTAIYGKNLDENIPEGMERYTPVGELISKPWMQQIFPQKEKRHATIFGTEHCGEDANAKMLSLGDRKDMDRLSDALRVNTSTSETGQPCVPTGSPVVLWRYLEGKGYDKEVAVKNLGDSPVSLGSFSIRLALNGDGWSKSVPLLADAVEPPGGIFSVVSSRAKSATLKEGADMSSSNIMFNGNDALGLFECGRLVDQIGEPDMKTRLNGKKWSATSVWNVGSGSTKDHFLYRSLSTTQGCTGSWKLCESQWDAVKI